MKRDVTSFDPKYLKRIEKKANALVQAILQEAEKLTDSTAKMLINSLAVLVGKG